MVSASRPVWTCSPVLGLHPCADVHHDGTRQELGPEHEGQPERGIAPEGHGPQYHGEVGQHGQAEASDQESGGCRCAGGVLGEPADHDRRQARVEDEREHREENEHRAPGRKPVGADRAGDHRRAGDGEREGQRPGGQLATGGDSCGAGGERARPGEIWGAGLGGHRPGTVTQTWRSTRALQASRLASGRIATQPLHVGISLLTLFPGRVGGTETSVVGVLAEFARGEGPERVTVLANRHVAAEYARFARGRVAAPSGALLPGRRLAAHPRARDGRRRALRLAGGARRAARTWTSSTTRSPFRSRALDVPSVVTLFDVQHLDLPRFFSPPERVYPALGLRGRRARGRRRGHDAATTRARGLSSPAGSTRSGSRSCPWASTTSFRARAAATRTPPCSSGRPARSASSSIPPNLWPHKNHERLVEAFAAWRTTTSRCAHGPALRTARARDGRMRDEPGVPIACCISATWSRARCRRSAGARTAMVFPSLYEGFGTPPLEAMACGCPVASSDRASLRRSAASGAAVRSGVGLRRSRVRSTG